MRRAQMKLSMKVGIKANKLQTHFRQQVNFWINGVNCGFKMTIKYTLYIMQSYPTSFSIVEPC